MNKLLSSGLAIGAMISLVGCGGGSSSNTSMDIGYFVDSYVAGLNYTCSSGKTDITTTEGQYSCNAGDTVKFSLGGYSLGAEVNASEGIVTPDDLWPNDPTASENVTRLLLTVTSVVDGTLVVPENFTTLDDSTVELNATSGFTADIAADLNIDPTAVATPQEAQDHLDQSEVLLFLAGSTFYLSDSEGMERLDFSADGTSVTIKDLVSGNSQSMSISIEGDTITAGDGTTVRVDMTSLTTNTITVYSDEGTGEVQETWYLDQADRLKDLLATNTWTSSEITVTFDAEVTSIEIQGGGSDTVTLDGMTLTHSDGTDLIIIVSDTELIFDDGTGFPSTFTLVP